jgi:hypothetical protein
MMNIETIYVYLPGEATDCWYPARAERLGGDTFRLIDPSPEDPVLEFGQGDIVRCRPRQLTSAIPPYAWKWVAYEKASG